MFHVSYQLKPFGSVGYTIKSTNAAAARREADRHFRTEYVGVRIGKVTVRPV